MPASSRMKNVGRICLRLVESETRFLIADWFRFGSSTEIVDTQRIGSAIKRSAESIPYPISGAISSQFGQEPTFKMAAFDFFFTTGDTLRLVEGSGLYFLFTSGTTHESKLECEH